MSRPQSPFYSKMSIHGEMEVGAYNKEYFRFNTFNKQLLSLGTIPETPENINMTIADVILLPKLQVSLTT